MDDTFDRNRGFTLERLLDAPPEMVFRCWTEPDLLGWFFNPGMPVDGPATVDLRVGGAWRQLMVINAGERYVTGGVYREIVPGRRLVFSWGAAGGWPALDPADPDRSPRVTIDLEAAGGQTRMLFHVQFRDQMSDAELEEWIGTRMRDGWGMTIDRLVGQLALPRRRAAGG